MDAEEDVPVLVGMEEKEKQDNQLNVITVKKSGAIRMNVPIGKVKMQILQNLMTQKKCCLWLKKGEHNNKRRSVVS